MKKLFALMLALLMVVSMAACSKDGESGDDLQNYEEDEIVIDHEVIGDETFYFDDVDSETVMITGYQGNDVPHTLNIPTVLNNKTVVEIADKAFYFCSKINVINIPETVTKIGNYAFAGCSLVTTVNLPSTLTSIGTGAFYECSALTAITIPTSLKVISDNAFYLCTALTSVTVPGSVEVIGNAAFFGCSALNTVVLSDGVAMVGAQAFQKCSALENLTLPSTLTLDYIGTDAFAACEKLTKVTCVAGTEAETYVKTILKLEAVAPAA